MAKERYSDMNMDAVFGLLSNALENKKGGDGDTDRSFPRSDAEDMSKGARFIPYEVTLARRAGKKVNFVTKCTPNCWYWEMPDGTRIYYKTDTVNSRKGRKSAPCQYCGGTTRQGGANEKR